MDYYYWIYKLVLDIIENLQYRYDTTKTIQDKFFLIQFFGVKNKSDM